MKRTEREIDQKFAVICYAAALLVSALASSIVAATVDVKSNLYLYLCYILPQVGYIGVFGVMYYRYGKPLKSLVKKENVHGLHYVYAVMVALGVLFFALLPNNYIRQLIAKIGSNATTVVPQFIDWWDYLLSAIIICVLPAIGEELVFRKAFCDGMEDVADYKVILLCGLAFSLSHLSLAQTIHQFFLGCILGFIYVKTKNITLTMLIHFINNAIALFLEKITGAEIWTQEKVLIISCVAGFVMLLGGLLLFWFSGNKLKNGKGKIEAISVLLFVVLGVAWAACVGMSFAK